MKSPNIALPSLLVILVVAFACVSEETTVSETSETITATDGTTAYTATTEPPSDQIAEGAQQVGEGLGKAGRGVAQATGEALQRAGEEIQQAARPEGTAAKPPASTTASAPQGGGSAAAGGRVYAAKNCAACHGINGAGGTPIAQRQNIAPLGSPGVQAKSDAELARILTEGGSAASAGAHKSKNLTPDEVRDLVAWIRSL